MQVLVFCEFGLKCLFTLLFGVFWDIYGERETLFFPIEMQYPGIYVL